MFMFAFIFMPFCNKCLYFRGKTSQQLSSMAMKCAMPFAVDFAVATVPTLPSLCIDFSAFALDELSVGEEDEEPRIRALGCL